MKARAISEVRLFCVLAVVCAALLCVGPAQAALLQTAPASGNTPATSPGTQPTAPAQPAGARDNAAAGQPAPPSETGQPARQAVASPIQYFRGALDRFVNFLPDLVAGLITLLIGYIIAKVVYNLLLRVLPRTRLDRFLREQRLASRRVVVAGSGAERNQSGSTLQRVEHREDELEASHPGAAAISKVAFWLIMLVAVMQVAQMWRFQMLASGIGRFFAYVPHLIAAAVIFGISLWIADFVRDRIVGQDAQGRATLVGGGVKAVILAFGGFLALRELQIAPDIVRLAFIFTMGSIAVATALAVGLGGRAAVERMATDMYSQNRHRVMRQAAGQPEDRRGVA